MRQGAPQIIPHPRHVAQILRLVVAAVEPGENAEDLGGALRGERRIEPGECDRVEIRIDLAPRTDVAAEQRDSRPPSGTSTRASWRSEARS